MRSTALRSIVTPLLVAAFGLAAVGCGSDDTAAPAATNAPVESSAAPETSAATETTAAAAPETTAAAAPETTAAPAALDPIALRFANSPPTPAMAPFFVARDEGFFEEQGINIDFVNLDSGAAFVPAMAGGSIDGMNSSIGAIGKAKESGLDLVVTNGHSSGFDYALVIPTGSKLDPNASFEDKMAALKGLSIGTQGGPQSLVLGFVFALLNSQGMKPEDVTGVDLAFGGPQLAALQTNQVDLVLADRTTIAAAQDQGLGTVYFDLLTDAPDEFNGLLIAGSTVQQSFVDAHPDFPERMFTAMDKAYKFMQDPANIDEVVRVAVDSVGLPESDSLKTVLTNLPKLLGAQASQATLQKTVDFMYKTATWTKEPKITVDSLFLPPMIGS